MAFEQLRKKASRLRLATLEATVKAGKGHLGGTFSCVELLIALYYSGFLRIDLNNYKKPSRDYFFIGKGHACMAIYWILLDLGFISRERYDEYGADGSSLGGQLDLSIPGVENNTGSLGHALGLAAGVSLAKKLDQCDGKAICLIGDAECEEGSIWESIIFAAEKKLNNLICIVDRNRLSVIRAMEDDILFSNFKEKIELFGWNCEVIDGHDFNEISAAFEKSKLSDKPCMILANTVKGKGVSFMEGITKWHHSIPTEKEINIAREELRVDD